jgi:hypothetical protein
VQRVNGFEAADENGQWWKGRDGQVAEEDDDDGQCRPAEDHGRQ